MRLTVRQLLLAVAVVAVVFWSAILIRKSLDYRRRAPHHEGIALMLAGEIQNLTKDLEAALLKGAATPGLESQIRIREDVLAEERRASASFRERATALEDGPVSLTGNRDRSTTWQWQPRRHTPGWGIGGRGEAR